MNAFHVWDLYFSAVCSFRFHPKNVEFNVNEVEADHIFEVQMAAKIADAMMEERLNRAFLEEKIWVTGQQLQR